MFRLGTSQQQKIEVPPHPSEDTTVEMQLAEDSDHVAVVERAARNMDAIYLHLVYSMSCNREDRPNRLLVLGESFARPKLFSSMLETYVICSQCIACLW